MVDRGYLGEDKSLTIEFSVEGDLVVPDAGTTTYTVRDADGTPIVGLVDKPLMVNSTKAIITILAANHATAGYRHVSVAFQFQGTLYHVRRSYLVTTFVPIAACEDDVRVVLALTPDELPDSDIDLHYGYQTLLDDGFDLSSVLTATDSTAVHANRAVVLKTALQLTTTLPLRALSSEKSDVGGVTRFSTIDWKALQRRLSGLLSDAVLKATGGTATSPVFLVTTAPTDPITGA